MRNSSLVKWHGADNVTGLKPATEAANSAFGGVVRERSAASEAGPEGPVEVAEAIMPARVAIISVKNRDAVSLRFPGEG